MQRAARAHFWYFPVSWGRQENTLHVEDAGPSPAAISKREWDVIVVGAGVLGAFHAWFAARRGLRTLLSERGEMPADASVRNFGTLVPSAMTPGEWHRRAVESAAVYRDLADQIRIPLQRHGTQYLATTTAEAAVLEEFSRL